MAFEGSSIRSRKRKNGIQSRDQSLMNQRLSDQTEDSDDSDYLSPPTAKRFSYVNKWIDEPIPSSVSEVSRKIAIFCSLGSSNINVVKGKKKSVLIDCGILDNSCEPYSSFEKIDSAVSISELTFFKSTPSIRVLNSQAKTQEQRRIKWAKEKKHEVLRRKKLQNYLDKLVLTQGTSNFNCIIITSKDADNWNLLPLLFFDANGFIRNQYKVKSLVIHGSLDSYGEKFESFLNNFRSNFPTTEIFFTSSKLLVNTDHPLSDYKNLLPSMIAPKALFYGFDSCGRSRYKVALTETQYDLPFQRYLNIGNNVKVYFPVLNNHHRPWSSYWSVGPPLTSGKNYDVLPVAVSINSFTVLFMGDATSDVVGELLEHMKVKNLSCHFDIIVCSHNGSHLPNSFDFEHYKVMEPGVVLCPLFEKEGYPKCSFIDQFEQSLTSLTTTVERSHTVMFYTEQKEKQFRKMNKHFFTLHMPVTLMFDGFFNCCIRQA